MSWRNGLEEALVGEISLTGKKKRNKSIKIRSALFLNVAGPSKVILFKFLTLTVICIHVRIHLPQKILDLDSAIVVNQ